MTGRTLMVQGTSSSAGKSTLVTGLCRLYRDRGYSVAPFKSQNMALNASVTRDGLEIGRSQAVQAEAARITATVDMNPILLKPEPAGRCQVVVLGRPVDSVHFSIYDDRKLELRRTIKASLDRLRSEYDLVIIEGAGSPAEINLRDRDLVNMHVAREADAPVLLVGDIDRGGVFASFVGTLALLEPSDRERVKGFVVNRFRGDVELLKPGLVMLEERTGVPTLGVVPHMSRLRIADEDSLDLDQRGPSPRTEAGELDIVVIRLPHISNFDDFLPLEHEPGVNVRYVDDASTLDGADLVILPGSKSTISDLATIRTSGVADALLARAKLERPILGVCGGCQMLGGAIEDPEAFESATRGVTGLGLLPITTRFHPEKRTRQLVATALRKTFLTPHGSSTQGLRGYEIHAGRIHRDASTPPAFSIQRAGDAEPDTDGAATRGVVGTMIHGIFNNDELRRAMLNDLRSRRGLPVHKPESDLLDDPYDRLAGVLSSSLEIDRIDQLIFG